MEVKRLANSSLLLSKIQKKKKKKKKTENVFNIKVHYLHCLPSGHTDLKY
jgi:hypothetical protein